MVNIAPEGSGSDDSGSAADTTTDDDRRRTRTERVAREAAEAEPDPAPEPAPPDPEPTRTSEGARRARDQQTDSTTEAAAEESAAPDTRTGQVADEARQQQADSTTEAAAAEQGDLRETVADQTSLQESDIRLVDTIQPDTTRVERGAREATGREMPGTQFQPVLTEEARAEQVAGQFDRDPQRMFSGTERIPVGVDEPTADDITFGPGGDPQFTDEFADEVRDAQFDREAARISGVNPGVEMGDIGFEQTDSGTRLTDDSRAALATAAAAEQDPLRGPDEFVATTDDGEVDVRRRADPFFEQQREAVGVDLLPGRVDDALTTDTGESRIRRGLQETSTTFSEFAAGDSLPGQPAPVERPGAAADEFGAEGGLFDLGADIERGGAAALNLPGAALGAATAAEQAADVGQAEAETRAGLFSDADIQDPFAPVGEPGENLTPFDVAVPEGSAAAEERAQTSAAVEQTASQTVETATERPGLFIGAVGAGAAISAGSGLALGRGLRGARGRVRTAGGTEIDAGDIVNPQTRRLFDEGEAGEPFPPFRDPELARSDPARAVSRQADEFTPRALDEGIPGQDPVLFKALDTEPEGPGTGRVAQGLRTQEGSYESPGAFVGPELSPNFLRLSGPREFSLRPGLPDTGGRPTAVAVRTDVENPDADTMRAFNRELLDREGETTARPKPPDAINPGEAEAVIPGEATFADVGGGPVRNTLRRAGIGSDFYTEIGGQRVPIRTVAPADEVGDTGSVFGRFLGDERGQVGAGGAGDTPAFSGRLAEFESRAGRQAVDRPAPLAGSGMAAPSDTFNDTFGVRAAEPSASRVDGVESVRSPFGTESFDAPPSGGTRRRDEDPASRPAGSGGDSGFGSGLFSGGAMGSGIDAPAPSSPASPAPPSDPAGPPSAPGSPGPSPFGPSPAPSPFGPAPSPFGPVPSPYSPPPTSPPPAGGGDGGEFDEEEPFRALVAPETPEFVNPIASGVEDIFGY